MQAAIVVLVVIQCCDIRAIKVPVVWDSDSEVKNYSDEEPKTSADKIETQNLQQPIPIDYFQYTAKKPQFAVDIAAFHGVKSPENHYKAYPVRPYTGQKPPELGKHRIQEAKRPVFNHFQEYINKDEDPFTHVTPASASYEVFHPYKAEEPGLQELYKDPVLDKIRNDIRDSSQRLQTYENEPGKPDIASDEYLESVEETDRKKIPQRNIPAPYEIHRPQRRPIYYRPLPRNPHRDHVLNQRFRHPWNQNYVKVRPLHYQPLKNHLHRLRQHHALTYDDERNEYPQVPRQEHYEEPSDGYDIYEKGKAKYVQLRNNLDESISNAVRESRPSAPQKLELQSYEQPEPDEEEEFIPVKNYAQVRKTETTKHLPKSAAFDDADSLEEIKNAPRLREAIKSTKAQTVYSEEGYEDSAYDHAGEQKHASDHEGHAGYLKEKELSSGKYKTPSVSGSYEDGQGSAYKNQVVDGKEWADDKKETQQEEDAEDYSEDEQEASIEAESYQDSPDKKGDYQRNKREGELSSVNQTTGVDDANNSTSQHDVNKRETNDFKIPEINFNSTFLNEKDILQIAKEKIVAKDELTEKYPYYFKDFKTISKNSPLRYAENLKHVPKKSHGGTEFYDSRTQFECPEVDDKVDPIPEKLKKDGHPDESDDESDTKNDNKKGELNDQQPRLQGLGDKIDCFKAKYFGENPLDSPFFKEELIENPEPITIPSKTIFKFRGSPNNFNKNDFINNEMLRKQSEGDIFSLLDKVNKNQISLLDTISKGSQELRSLFVPQNASVLNNVSANHQQNNVYTDVIQNIKNNISVPFNDLSNSNVSRNLQSQSPDESPATNKSYESIQNKEEVTKAPLLTRKKRATIPFMYEPYKIIRDVQISDSKKKTTASNISPLIKQLQSSKVIDAVIKSNNDKDQPVKRNIQSRTYKDIGKNDRGKSTNTANTEATFIDVNVDKRRGEPRYELEPSNHKSQYSPVDNKRAMSIEDYEARAKQKASHEENEFGKQKAQDSKAVRNNKRPSARAVYDISRFLPKNEELQNPAASNTVKTAVTSSPPTIQPEKERQVDDVEDDNESEEDYDDEYEDDEEDEETPAITTTTTTTTTSTTTKPAFRRRIRSTTTTTEKEEITTEEPPKLRLVTRFRNSVPAEKIQQSHTTEYPIKRKKYTDEDEPANYREKKKKSTKSTLVTDTKRYGDDVDDDMRKEEVDALIGVKQNMDDYKPLYEKEEENKNKTPDSSEENESSEDDDDDDDEEDDDDDDEEYDEDADDDEENEDSTPEPSATTTEAPRRTLARTTDAPPSTTETRPSKEVKPVITRKKIEIHKESPVNKSSPHTTQFKQDIKEIEIIKEMPRTAPVRKPHKNVELLDLYKDDNLAKDINKLEAVEIFKEDLDLMKGPKHGGNYRRAPDLKDEVETTTLQNVRRRKLKAPKDAEASQTENKKQIELDDDVPDIEIHGGNLKSVSDLQRSSGRKEKLIELTPTETSDTRFMHGGNLKALQDRGRRRFRGKSEKLIELSEESDEDDDSSMHGGNIKSQGSERIGRGNRGRLHGGNYRSAKIVAVANEKGETTEPLTEKKNSGPKNAVSVAAGLLNSFAQAAPVLTTTPAYILDPSKRMYYYVDA
ncbi:hypothetical protein ABMA28_015948 [Loxostege sticticalis]|uniref:Uncharacterized protein n=1 Tax=Loxostege sticticalis TaxID=481309 RepID=A0ABD0TDG5_LOXSC